ncbi:hypothetical protein [Thalassobaculum litoreum]|uniref:hypothetical protein n=1 Tax=Thalassobaculum litoreum TaxID=420996 RepID=UPI000B80F3DF|nr:hypothetical protein [Thalassobaculum litoreum]
MNTSNQNRFRTEIDVFQRLRADLIAIAAGDGPTEAELAAAPIVDLYEVTTRSLPAIAGQIDGQSFGPSDCREASLLILYAPKLGWVMTRSGYFRLGAPATSK